MKKRLGLLALAWLLATGCGGNNDDVSFNGASGGTQSSTVIPSAGGEVPIPQGTGFTGSLIFEPGADAQTRISLSASTTEPSGTSFPLVGLDSPQATTESFFFLSLHVDKPVPLSLLEGARLQGDIPIDREQYHVDLFEYTSGGALFQGEGNADFLQEIPGEYVDSVATFDEVQHGDTLEPGRSYLMRFKSTEQQLLELTLINDSSVSPCYVYITGRNPNLAANDQRFYYVNFAEKQLTPMDVDDLENGFADYAIELPSDGKLFLPLMAAGRVYISLGERMKTELYPPRDENGPPALWVSPSGWSNPNEPNFKTLFDWVEFDYKISPDSNLPGMGINKTEVQMVSLPLTISMTGPSHGTRTVGAKEGARSAIFQELNAEPEFAGLIIAGPATGTDVDPIRVISPDNGINNNRNNIPGVPTFPLDYYDSYIDAVWTKYKSEDLEMVTSAFGTYLGRVNAQDEMVFTQTGKRDVVVPKPSSADVIIGDGALIDDVRNAAPGEEEAVVREIASTMSACFNRSTLLVFPRLLRTYMAGAFDPAIFYQDPTTNVYSKLIHSHSLPTEEAPLGAAYGFGFDDNLDQSSFIGDNRGPTAVTITVTKF
jgi:glycosyl hydrolase family 64 (putative beta-1,3-glucanase)